MFIPQPVAENECIDDNYISDLFNNLEYFERCSRTNSKQFTCTRIEETKTSVITSSSSELCFDLQSLSTSVNPNSLGSEIEQKFLAFNIRSSSSYSISDSDNPGQVSTRRETRIVCNGQTIKTLNGQDMGGPIILSCFECPANSKVELCFDSRIVTTGQTTFPRGTQSIQICGALVCIKEVVNDAITGLFVPPKFSTDCCYGREAIHLGFQNVQSLAEGFSNFGQVPSCITYKFEDQDDHTLISSASTVTDFLILGQITICGTNTSTTSAANISGEPRFSCGSEDYTCLSLDTTIPSTGGDGPTTACVQVPVVMCGTCQPGDSLISSIRSEYVCNESPSQVVQGIQAGVTLVQQDFCVYIFERLDTDFGDGFSASIKRCLDVDQLNRLNDIMTQIDIVCNNQRPITLTTREVSGVATNGDCVIIQEALPPPVDGSPAGVKKWYLLGSVLPCVASLAGLNLEDVRQVRAEASITCGGIEVDSGFSRWQLSGSGGSQLCGRRMPFGLCIECPQDEAIEICFSGTRTDGAPGFRVPDEFTYSFKMICF